MGDMVRVGIIGFSEGNGHPFSFSAIINGYSEEGLARSGWDVIHHYVRRRDPVEFGFGNVRVTHAWSQDPALTRRLCDACLVPQMVSSPDQFVGAVDAVIIARDDYDTHFGMAMPLLEAGLYVFVDKPLSLDLDEIRALKPYLEKGQLMSCSALRYAFELDEVRVNRNRYGTVKLVHATVLNSWEKYGIHMLEAVDEALGIEPVSIVCLEAGHASFAITMSDGSLLQVNALGAVPKTFQIDIWGTELYSTHQIVDNFSSFRRTLGRFFKMIQTRRPVLAPEATLRALRTLIAGRIAFSEQRKVFIDHVEI